MLIGAVSGNSSVRITNVDGLRRRCARWIGTALCALALCSCHRESVPQPRRIVDLSPPLTADVNIRLFGPRTLQFLGTDGRVSTSPVIPTDPTLAFGTGLFQGLTHSGSHLDAPSRLLRGGEQPFQVSLDRLYGKARLVDLRWHSRYEPIQISDLQRTPIAAGEIVLLFVGYEPPSGPDWPRYATLSAQAAQWLEAKGVKAVGTDLPSLGSFEEISRRLHANLPAEAVWAEYLPLLQARIPIVQGLVNLQAIAEEPNLAFGAFPLPLVEAGGAPVRAVAFVY